MLNSDLPDDQLTTYKVFTKRSEFFGITLEFARTDLTHWLYTCADGTGTYSGYGSFQEMETDKKYLASNGVLLIDYGLLEKVEK